MCDCDFCKMFFKELFDIGRSSGSLVGEAISLFRTFQKLSSTRTFSVHLSSQCLKMFTWVKEILNIFQLIFYSDPFNTYELFLLYTFVFPILILSLISALYLKYNTLIHILLYGILFMLGTGIGYIPYNIKNVLAITIPCVFLIIVLCCCHAWKLLEKLEYYDNKCPFTFALLPTFIAFSCAFTPFILHRVDFTLIFVSIISGICFFSMLIEFIYVKCCYSKSLDHFEKVTEKIIGFGTGCFSLLTIPSAENFISLVLNYGPNWNIITSYIAIGIILPIFVTFILMICTSRDIYDKYKKGFDFYLLFELFDVIRQICFAIVAGLDLPWACLIIEIGWCIALFSIFPYQNKSEYCLSFGSSFVVIVSNAASLYAEYTNKAYFSFTFAVIVVVLACLPPIIALYIHFCCDFKVDDDDDDDDFIDNNDEINIFFPYITPFVWLFYGLNVSLIQMNYCSALE